MYIVYISYIFQAAYVPIIQTADLIASKAFTKSELDNLYSGQIMNLFLKYSTFKAETTFVLGFCQEGERMQRQKGLNTRDTHRHLQRGKERDREKADTKLAKSRMTETKRHTHSQKDIEKERKRQWDRVLQSRT